jgi:small subunit ribosomal protein S31
MEVICVGLSKNPFISVEKKIEHINWFRDYFERKDHHDILKLTGAIEA